MDVQVTSNQQPATSNPQHENENIEINLLLEAIYLKYGYDFREYAKAHMKRRIMHRLSISGLDSISEMQNRILNDQPFFEVLLLDLSINTTEMFRDPSFYRTLRKEVIPVLKSYQYIKIWHAGCSTGEEVYSTAILLKEEGIYDKVQIYATDFNHKVIEKAKEGVYPIEFIKEYTHNYQKAGGQGSFSDYYRAMYDSVILDKSLKENIVFADHNLVTDRVFGEMNMIICRNVLIYFNRKLQSNVIELFLDSLCHGCFLCLGSKESLRFTGYSDKFETVNEKDRIFKKK